MHLKALRSQDVHENKVNKPGIHIYMYLIAQCSDLVSGDIVTTFVRQAYVVLAALPALALAFQRAEVGLAMAGV